MFKGLWGLFLKFLIDTFLKNLIPPPAAGGVSAPLPWTQAQYDAALKKTADETWG